LSFIRDGRPEATVIHSATRAETYTAVRGGGALRNGEPIRPSVKTELGVCIAATNQPPFINRQPMAIAQAASSLAAMLPIVGAVRNFGPTSWQIADTAAGRLDLFWEYGHDEETSWGPR
jgi:myo-inositol-1(or 4)-monophosphatase